MRAVARFADGLTLAFCAVSGWGWDDALAGSEDAAPPGVAAKRRMTVFPLVMGRIFRGETPRRVEI